MKSIIKKITTIGVVLSFSFVQIAFAQADAPASPPPVSASSVPDTSTPVATPPSSDASSSGKSSDMSSGTSVPTSAPAQVDAAAGTAAVNPQDAAGVSMQSTYNGQSAVSSDTLVSTTDPQSASSTDVSTQITLLVASSSSTTSADSQSLPIADASSTPVSTVSATSTADVVGQVSIANTPDASSTLTDTPTVPDPQQSTTTDPATTQEASDQPQQQSTPIPISDLKPKPQYAFALTGKTIQATLPVHHTDGTVTQVASASEVLTPVVDNTTGEVTISGQCSAAYFVVLLFKNAKDYAEDPTSYIVNRAYPCTGGVFTYSISDLPYNLPNGNYYLLVGQEGTSGGWTPITSLSEIAINRNQ